ncbi:MAG: matrixin family metalloprotease [Azospirillaceae bacterium]|nr:matrixin family metalloprotease [Azospirillaceae bacterium]
MIVAGSVQTVNVDNTTVVLTDGAQAVVNGSGDTIVEDGTNTAWVYGNNNTLDMAADSGAVAVVFGGGDVANASGDLVNVTDGSNITVNGSGNDLGLVGDDTTVWASDDTFNMLADITGATISGSGDNINVGAGFSGNVTGSGDTVNMDANGDAYVGVYGTDQTVNNDTGNDYANVAGDGSSVDFTGSGDNFGIVSNDDLVTASGDTVNLLSGISGIDITGSGDAINAGSDDDISVDGIYDDVYGNASDEVDFTGGDYIGDDTSGGVGEEGGGYGYGYYGFYGLAGSAAKVKATLGQDIGSIAQRDLASGDQTAAAVAVAGLQQAAAVAALTPTDGTGSAVLEGAKWDSQVVTWAVGSGVDESVVAQAFATWGAATGITFQEVTDPSQANIDVQAADLDTADSGVVGYTTDHTADGAITQATVRVEDTGETALVTDASGQQVYDGTAATLSQTLLHEIGHALGFADTSDQASVMYYALGTGNRTLDATDLTGATTLYGGATNLAQLTQATATFDTGTSTTSTLVAANDDTQAPPLLAANGH